MLLRDLAERKGFGNVTALRYFLKRLAASATKQISVHRIFNELKSAGVKIGKNTLYSYLHGAEDIFLAHMLPKYSTRISTRELGEKKVYFIDNGLLNAIRFRFSADRGKAMEQIVYWKLMRMKSSRAELFFYKNSYECDFLIQDQNSFAAFQVCHNLEEPETKQREIKGLVKTCKALDLNRGTIITRSETNEITKDGVRITVKPLAEFLLRE